MKKILLSHGSGGKLSRQLIKDLFLKKFNNPILKELGDSASIDYLERIAFTTDSFVVSPLDFPGADIGKLAVCGTVNDLVMQGALPEYLSLALIIEEGLDYKILERVIDSIAVNAAKAGVRIVTGDTKIVEKGACDKIFINTAGIGRVIKGKSLSIRNIRPGDKVIITGSIGEHGLAVLSKRNELGHGFNIKSDTAALNGLIVPLLKKTKAIRFMRDPTRGGVAAVLNEIAEGAGCGVVIDEQAIPISSSVRAACELLGIDPLYVANEGKAVIIAKDEETQKILKFLRRHPLGRRAQVIGTIAAGLKGRVILNTAIGSQRIVDMMSAEPLPRIC